MGPVSTGLGEVLMYVVDYAPAGTKANPKIAGKPGFQPDGSYMTPAGKLLTDDVAKARLSSHGAGLGDPAPAQDRFGRRWNRQHRRL
jgi:hypothetical protein